MGSKFVWWVNFNKANLVSADITLSKLNDSDLNEAKFDWTIRGATDLRTAKGLESIHHNVPSILGITTIYISRGEIPESFLKGVGVLNNFINFIRSLRKEKSLAD